MCTASTRASASVAHRIDAPRSKSGFLWAHRDMGLYDDRLAALSESRKPRAAGRSTPSRRSPPFRPGGAPVSERRSMRVQSLLFGRDAGWTASKAKAWAKSHGYSNGKVDVTEQYVRIRQFDPKAAKALRTVPFGRGIRAVVAREAEGNSMATPRTVNASRRRSRKKTSKRARRARTAASAAPKRRRRRRKVAATAAPKRRRRKTRVMEASKRRRRSPKRRRRVAREAWRGDSAGHAKAARKGWRRKKKSGSAPKRRRRSRRMREASVVAAPRRRKRSGLVMAKRRRGKRRSRRMHSNILRASNGSMGVGTMLLAATSAGFGYVIADGLDRFLATYNPSKDRPTDRFTSDGSGTLGNTLNVASRPGLIRAGAAVLAPAVPAVGAMFVRNKTARIALHGAAIGMGVNTFKLIWNNFVMPMLRPKDSSPAELQKSFIARLYPAEVAAAVNMAKKNPDGSERAPQLSGPGALSGADVGPFALSGDSPYPDAAQALRRDAGIHGPGGDYPTLQNTWGTGDYPTAQQAIYQQAGQVGAPWQPGPPPGTGPGPKAADGKECGCVGADNPFLGFIEGAPEEQPFPYMG